MVYALNVKRTKLSEFQNYLRMVILNIFSHIAQKNTLRTSIKAYILLQGPYIRSEVKKIRSILKLKEF